MRSFKSYKSSLFLKFISFFCILTSIIFVIIDVRLRPMMNKIAQNESKRQALILINSSVHEVINENTEDFKSIISLSTDKEGKPTALLTDAVTFDNLICKIFDSIHKKADNAVHAKYSVNIGSLTNSPLLYGTGPKINIKIQISQYINYEIISTFSSAGINQTKNSLYLRLTTTIFAVMPGGKRYDTVTNDYLFAETILLGNVPEAYTEVIQVGTGGFDTADTLVNFGQ